MYSHQKKCGFVLQKIISIVQEKVLDNCRIVNKKEGFYQYFESIKNETS